MEKHMLMLLNMEKSIDLKLLLKFCCLASFLEPMLHVAGELVVWSEARSHFSSLPSPQAFP